MTPEADVEVLSDGIPCGDCAEVFTGEHAARDRGLHRYRVHKVGGKKGKGAATEEEHRERPVRAMLRDVAGDVDGKGAPTANALNKAFGRALGMTTMAVASYYVETDPTIPFTEDGERQRNALVDELSLSPRASEDLMGPFGRALAPTKLNHRYGRAIVDNIDVVPAIDELALLVLRWRRAFRDRRQREEQMGLRQTPADIIDVQPLRVVPEPPAGPPPPPMAQPAAPTPGPVVIDGQVAPQSPHPSQGVVVSAAMVEDMKRRKHG